MPKLILKPGGKFRAEVQALDASGDPTTDIGDAQVKWVLSESLPGTITPDPENPFVATGELGEQAGDGQVIFTLSIPGQEDIVKTADIAEKAGPVAGVSEIGLTEVQP